VTCAALPSRQPVSRFASEAQWLVIVSYGAQVKCLLVVMHAHQLSALKQKSLFSCLRDLRRTVESDEATGERTSVGCIKMRHQILLTACTMLSLDS
jgi:hypothetical protein